MEFIRLTKEIFEKNAKNRMRVPHAVKLHSNSMLQCILKYGDRVSDKIPFEHFSDCIRHIRRTNRWVDVVNNTFEKKCEPINDVNHPHIYELLSYSSYIECWW